MAKAKVKHHKKPSVHLILTNQEASALHSVLYNHTAGGAMYGPNGSGNGHGPLGRIMVALGKTGVLQRIKYKRTGEPLVLYALNPSDDE